MRLVYILCAGRRWNLIIAQINDSFINIFLWKSEADLMHFVLVMNL